MWPESGKKQCYLIHHTEYHETRHRSGGLRTYDVLNNIIYLTL